MRGIDVLSLYDGISGGMASLDRAEISVNRYAAYEIDKHAIQISKKNYPKIEHYGDVTTADFTQYKGFDLLLGGSPCTHWSIAKNNRETTPEGIGWDLFMHYKRALVESECKYFLYENNFSIHKDIKAAISKELGVEPIMINSALVSAQNRKRCYWTNIPGVEQPQDRGILLKDVLESGVGWQDKSYYMTARYSGAVFYNTLERHQKTMVAEPVMCVPEATKQGYTVINPGECVDLAQPNSKTRRGRKMSDKSNCLTTGMSFYQHVGIADKPVRIGTVNHGGNPKYDSKQWRVYSVVGKSVTLCGQGGGAGAKTGLYKVNLPDGDYIIRKLTPIEAERLQTLPDNYTEGISNTQRYKCIGNGWTVEVIAHILKGLRG